MEWIVDEHVLLRPVRWYDAEELYIVLDAHRASLALFLPWVRTTTLRDVYAMIEAALRQEERGEGYQTVILYDRRIVGFLGMHRIDWTHRNTSLGYWLAPPFQGRGIMTRAVRVLVDYAFRHMRLHRIEIRAAVENTRSRRVAERLGFREEGVLREVEWLGDRYVDHVVYGLLESEWPSRTDRV